MSSSRVLAVFFSVLAALATAEDRTSVCKDASPVYDFKLKDLYGKKVGWNQYKHKIILVINVATF